jgi:hypothetical protein
MNPFDISSLGKLANDYQELVKEKGSTENIYLKIEGDKPILVSDPGFRARRRSRDDFKFAPLADKIKELYTKELESVAHSNYQLTEEQLEKLEKFTNWFEGRVKKYNAPSLFTRLFRSKREDISSTALGKLELIKYTFFTKQLCKLLPELLGKEGEQLSQRLASPLGRKEGFPTIEIAEAAIRKAIITSLDENVKLIERLKFNRNNETVLLPHLQEQEALAETLKNGTFNPTRKASKLKELTSAVKDLIQMTNACREFEKTYRQKFEQEKIPQWTKTFNEQFEKIRSLAEKEDLPIQKECNDQILNFKNEFESIRTYLLAQKGDLPQSNEFKILHDTVNAFIEKTFPSKSNY